MLEGEEKSFQIKRKPVDPRMCRTLKGLKQVLRRRQPERIVQALGPVLNGWLNDCVVPASNRPLRPFRHGLQCPHGVRIIPHAGFCCTVTA